MSTKGFSANPLGQFLLGMSPVIRWILLSCTGIWLVQVIVRDPSLWIWASLYRPFPYLWQLLTYQFLHSPDGLAHLVFNMFMLWVFGRELAGRWGTWPFLRFYLGCGVGAGLFHWLFSFVVPGHGYVVGASGALMGIAVAYAMLWPERQVLFMFLFPMKAKFAVMAWAVLDLMAIWNPHSGVANLAHLGGMLTGWIVLKYGWRLNVFGKGAGFLGDWKRSFDVWRRERRTRRSSLSIVQDQKEWDEWLEREVDGDGEETRH